MATVAIPLAEEFEDAEFSEPCQRLQELGHEVVVIGVEKDRMLRGKRGEASVRTDTDAEGLAVGAFDALLIPGGHSPDHLRTDPHIVDFVRRFWDTGRLVAAICHGPQLLIEADVVRGRELTSWPSVRKDLENAGAKWLDRPVVDDGQLITSRKPDDLDAFCDAIAARLGG